MALIGFIKRYKFSLFYLFLIPFVNWMFSWAPIMGLPDGGTWTPFAIITGLVLVFRDLAQREIGHKVILLLILGAVISYYLAAPQIAIVSALAFAVSEMVDWAVYSYTHKPLSQRIIYSSLLGAPLDTTIFLYGADMVVPGVFTFWSIFASVVSKLSGAFVVAYLVSLRENEVEILPNRPD